MSAGLTTDAWLALVLPEQAPAAEEVVLIARVTKSHHVKFPDVAARKAFGNGRGRRRTGAILCGFEDRTDGGFLDVVSGVEGTRLGEP